jgi:antitoxin (DNA-binding transcriptional repressor) of toxin-antitoxin stability system
VTKTVALEELRERLDDYVGDAERGSIINVTKDGRVVATIAPAEASETPSRPKGRLKDFVPGPRPTRLTVDPAAILIEERERERSK